jgi:dihydropyrimidine dehydrogenase (NAD+) subunit PreA
VIKELVAGMAQFLERHADRGWKTLDDFRGIRRDRIVEHSKIKRPDAKEYFGGHAAPEGYAAPIAVAKG